MIKRHLTDLELAYIAGFFDGEGSITIHHNWRPSPRGKSPNHTLQVSIGNTDPRVLTWIHSHFGGYLHVRKHVAINCREVTQWIVRAASALPFLEMIFPFLRMKSEQTRIAIEYQKTKKPAGGRGHRLTKGEIAWREKQRQKIRSLNGRAPRLVGNICPDMMMAEKEAAHL
jgi:hypothetical protein